MAFGISSQPLESLDLYRMYLTEMTLIFSRATTRSDFQRTVALVASERVALQPLLTREYSMEDAALAFQFAEEQQSQVLRVLINP